jgi:predicted GNAT superfamily acetyltransferase
MNFEEEEIVIARAELTDVGGIVSLAKQNAPDRGGELSVHFKHDDVAALIQALPAIVARRKGNVTGFLFAQEKSESNPPIVKAMRETYLGSENTYTYGPVCVDESVRGRGLAGMMFAELRRLLPGRQGVLFIKATNEPSLRAHRIMGMREVGEFGFQGTPFVIFAYDG